jgi:sensitive to high expression protein 9, mitochondrial
MSCIGETSLKVLKRESTEKSRNSHHSCRYHGVAPLQLPMLRRPLSRPSLLRPFSTSPPIWNTQRPTGVDAQHKDQLQSSPPPSQSLVDHDIKPEPIHFPTQYDSKPQSTTPRETLASYDLPIVKQRIRKWTEQATIALRNRADDFTANTKTTFSQLGSQLNRVTGYEEIEALKRGVVEQGVFVSHSLLILKN